MILALTVCGLNITYKEKCYDIIQILVLPFRAKNASTMASLMFVKPVQLFLLVFFLVCVCGGGAQAQFVFSLLFPFISLAPPPPWGSPVRADQGES